MLRIRRHTIPSSQRWEIAPHAHVRWAQRGPQNGMRITAALADASYVGRWENFYGYQWDHWVFVAVFTPTRRLCVSVWPTLWWARRVGFDMVWLDQNHEL